jgi:hypothetical protein
MARVCDECGKALSFRDSHVLLGRVLCGGCLVKLGPRGSPSSPSVLPPSAVATGAGAASGLRVFACLSIVGGATLALANSALGAVAVAFAVAGVFYAVELFAFAAVIDLLTVVAARSVREEPPRPA